MTSVPCVLENILSDPQDQGDKEYNCEMPSVEAYKPSSPFYSGTLNEESWFYLEESSKQEPSYQTYVPYSHPPLRDTTIDKYHFNKDQRACDYRNYNKERGYDRTKGYDTFRGRDSFNNRGTYRGRSDFRGRGVFRGRGDFHSRSDLRERGEIRESGDVASRSRRPRSRSREASRERSHSGICLY